jgi:hypothetical protein
MLDLQLLDLILQNWQVGVVICFVLACIAIAK